MADFENQTAAAWQGSVHERVLNTERPRAGEQAGQEQGRTNTGAYGELLLIADGWVPAEARRVLKSRLPVLPPGRCAGPEMLKCL